jgi:hypothetical protein
MYKYPMQVSNAQNLKSQLFQIMWKTRKSQLGIALSQLSNSVTTQQKSTKD